MKNSNVMIPKLYTLLSEELESREPYLTPRALSEGDRQRQGLVLTNARYFIAVLENHIMEHTASVVFAIELSEYCCTVRLYRPLQQKEYERLEASNYAPTLRSKIHLTVGLGKSGEIPYAYSAVKTSQYSSVIDFFDTLFFIGKELEKYLNQ